jgi:hypothetical protein
MSAPICPKCSQPITRALDAPYGWWEWDEASPGKVDVAPWVHYDCMGELREFHPQNYGRSSARVLRPSRL